jgi:hypothetical protein
MPLRIKIRMYTIIMGDGNTHSAGPQPQRSGLASSPLTLPGDFRISDFESWVSGFGFRNQCSESRAQRAMVFEFRVSSFESRVSLFGIKDRGFRFVFFYRVSGTSTRATVPGFAFRESSFGFRFSGSGFRLEHFGLQHLGPGHRILCDARARGTFGFRVS